MTDWAEVHRKRMQDPEYRAAKKLTDAAWYRRNKRSSKRLARKAADMRKYTRDPRLRMRFEARWKARRAIAAGRLVKQPCQSCGTVKSQVHHPDYSKPLEVIWLCVPCHLALHQQPKSITNDSAWRSRAEREGERS